MWSTPFPLAFLLFIQSSLQEKISHKPYYPPFPLQFLGHPPNYRDSKWHLFPGETCFYPTTHLYPFLTCPSTVELFPEEGGAEGELGFDSSWLWAVGSYTRLLFIQNQGFMLSSALLCWHCLLLNMTLVLTHVYLQEDSR